MLKRRIRFRGWRGLSFADKFVDAVAAPSAELEVSVMRPALVPLSRSAHQATPGSSSRKSSMPWRALRIGRGEAVRRDLRRALRANCGNPCGARTPARALAYGREVDQTSGAVAVAPDREDDGVRQLENLRRAQGMHPDDVTPTGPAPPGTQLQSFRVCPAVVLSRSSRTPALRVRSFRKSRIAVDQEIVLLFAICSNPYESGTSVKRQTDGRSTTDAASSSPAPNWVRPSARSRCEAASIRF